ncbi:MAG: hypothetical protein ACK5Y7_14060 [Betaproteobacteria bacterium]
MNQYTVSAAIASDTGRSAVKWKMSGWPGTLATPVATMLPSAPYLRSAPVVGLSMFGWCSVGLSVWKASSQRVSGAALPHHSTRVMLPPVADMKSSAMMGPPTPWRDIVWSTMSTLVGRSS